MAIKKLSLSLLQFNGKKERRSYNNLKQKLKKESRERKIMRVDRKEEKWERKNDIFFGKKDTQSHKGSLQKGRRPHTRHTTWKSPTKNRYNLRDKNLND